MQSNEAIQRAINGKTVDHARRLHLATVTVNKWQEPTNNFTDSGSLNPLDRIVTIMDGSRADGNGPERYLSPLHYLAIKFNQIVIPAPVPNKELPELHQGLMKMTKEFGELLSVSGEKFTDGDVSLKDARAIRQEVYEMQTALSAFLAKVEAAAAKD